MKRFSTFAQYAFMGVCLASTFTVAAGIVVVGIAASAVKAHFFGEESAGSKEDLLKKLREESKDEQDDKV